MGHTTCCSTNENINNSHLQVNNESIIKDYTNEAPSPILNELTTPKANGRFGSIEPRMIDFSTERRSGK
jgi:hypothetical protein